MNKKTFPFYFVIAALVVTVISPTLFTDGMFMDGIIYAALSNNLSSEIGSFWNLHFTQTVFPNFHEHPPLAIGLQSLLFNITGSGMYSERIYSLLCFIITVLIITRMWKSILKKNFNTLSWLPVLIFFSFPLISWTFSNNMLENTMMIFTTGSVWMIIRSLNSYKLLYLLTAGILLFFGFLSKGFVALFPLSVLFWIFILNRDYKILRFVIDFITLLSGLILPFIILYIFIPEGVESILTYVDKQVLGSINNVQTVNSRFYIFGELLQQIIPALLIVIVIYMISRRKKFSDNSLDRYKMKYVLLFTALSGIFPIMISLKQRAFYLTTVFPVLAIAISLFALPYVYSLIQKISFESKAYKIFKFISCILLVFSLVFSGMQFGETGRDKSLLTDIYTIIEIVPEHSVVNIEHKLKSKWELHAYFSRNAHISLDKDLKNKHDYLITLKNSKEQIHNEYQLMDIPLTELDLFCINIEPK